MHRYASDCARDRKPRMGAADAHPRRRSGSANEKRVAHLRQLLVVCVAAAIAALHMAVSVRASSHTASDGDDDVGGSILATETGDIVFLPGNRTAGAVEVPALRLTGHAADTPPLEMRYRSSPPAFLINASVPVLINGRDIVAELAELRNRTLSTSSGGGGGGGGGSSSNPSSPSASTCPFSSTTSGDWFGPDSGCASEADVGKFCVHETFGVLWCSMQTGRYEWLTRQFDGGWCTVTTLASGTTLCLRDSNSGGPLEACNATYANSTRYNNVKGFQEHCSPSLHLWFKVNCNATTNVCTPSKCLARNSYVDDYTTVAPTPPWRYLQGGTGSAAYGTLPWASTRYEGAQTGHLEAGGWGHAPHSTSKSGSSIVVGYKTSEPGFFRATLSIRYPNQPNGNGIDVRVYVETTLILGPVRVWKTALNQDVDFGALEKNSNIYLAIANAGDSNWDGFQIGNWTISCI